MAKKALKPSTSRRTSMLKAADQIMRQKQNGMVVIVKFTQTAKDRMTANGMAMIHEASRKLAMKSLADVLKITADDLIIMTMQNLENLHAVHNARKNKK